MQESTEVQTVAARYLAALGQGDAAVIAELYSRHPGVLSIGTDLNEWLEGYERIVGVLQQERAAVGPGPALVPGPISGYEAGDTGWFAARPAFLLSAGRMVPVRITGVLQREGAAWKIVQAHVSIGVAGAEAPGQELPA